MTYDYHGGSWDDVTGLNSPLYARDSSDSSANDSRVHDNWKNANYSINYWISNGCSPEKINLGLAAYG
jgi:chitinase